MPIAPGTPATQTRLQPTISIAEFATDPRLQPTAPVASQTLNVGPGLAPYLSAPFSGKTNFVTVRSNCSVAGFVGVQAAGGQPLNLAAAGLQTFAVGRGGLVGANTTEADPTIGGP